MNVLVSDYIPAGLVLNDSNWTVSGSVVTYNTALSLAPGANTTITLTATIDGTVTGAITNWAEISSDDGSDIGSTPDTDMNNDIFSGDNNTSGNGTGSEDEDDHDPVTITVVTELIPENGSCDPTTEGTLWYTGSTPSPLCTSGTATGLSYNAVTAVWTWSCEGMNGGMSDSCMASGSYCGDGIIGSGA